ncbi:MAG: hypothetical protein QOJ70_3315 [Acidobacteriota bacterium]|jgi:hypothetical protein|nr:hypothetical protein [Acidobacteriota bacterium]MDT7809502.1 hypothetical protein [Acidobacteriota bacterium]
MDFLTIVFVFILFIAAFLLTVTIRRDFKAKEQLRRDLQRQTHLPRPRRKP